jgi:formylglycine-generating enzyme required for sulfatase activity
MGSRKQFPWRMPIGKPIQKSLYGLVVFWVLGSCTGSEPERAPRTTGAKADFYHEEVPAPDTPTLVHADAAAKLLPSGSFTDTVNGIPFVMVAVAGGPFVMGDLFGEGEPDEQKHPVRLDDYWLGQTEVTQRLWHAVMGYNPSYYHGCPECPVEQICWQDAQKFLEKLNRLTGKSYRLPTEAEWEYAARERGRKIRFANGKDTIGHDLANYDATVDPVPAYAKKGRAKQRTIPVRSFPPNALGLFDMSGNVWEFCSDWYGEYGDSGQNPQGPKIGSYRVFRGGSWANSVEYCRATSRDFNAVGGRLDIYGFRLAHSR